MKQKLWVVCIALSSALFTGCNNDNDKLANVPSDAAQEAVQTGVSSTSEPSPTAAAKDRRAIVQATDQPADRSIAVMQADVPEYSGGGRSYIIEGEEVSADFSSHRTLPLGVLMPETMKRFEAGGVTAWGTADEQNFISLFAEEAKLSLTNSDAGLLRYKEYMGNCRTGNATVDVFSVEAKGKRYIAEIHTMAEQREHLLPVFVNILKDLQYMEKKTPIVPGVFVQIPDVGNSGFPLKTRNGPAFKWIIT
ncbi:hypothetical protein [Paenibacillus sp. sgz500992]|uniref:hypothetical protein n=1 Tax=Paenibacillus sp. sgz500992 TaxID=3242476 RepID=UPI0036D313A9